MSPLGPAIDQHVGHPSADGQVSRSAPAAAVTSCPNVRGRVHYGNNVSVPGSSDLSLSVVIGSEQVTVDGHLD
jgi:uncharacterized Zn-binding protein involved in type VI secretion